MTLNKGALRARPLNKYARDYEGSIVRDALWNESPTVTLAGVNEPTCSGGLRTLKRVVFVVGALSALGACVATRSLIDTASDHVVASIDVGANPHGLAISDDGSRVLVSGWGSNEAEVIDTSTGRVIGSVPVAQPHNGTLSRDVRVGWVASQKQDATALVRLDLAMWKEVARVPLNETPRGLELSPDGRRIFFTLAGVNAIQVLDTTTNQIVGASPHYPPFTPDGRWALAVVQGPGELGILNTANNTLAGLVLLGKAPH